MRANATLHLLTHHTHQGNEIKCVCVCQIHPFIYFNPFSFTRINSTKWENWTIVAWFILKKPMKIILIISTSLFIYSLVFSQLSSIVIIFYLCTINKPIYFLFLIQNADEIFYYLVWTGCDGASEVTLSLLRFSFAHCTVEMNYKLSR